MRLDGMDSLMKISQFLTLICCFLLIACSSAKKDAEVSYEEIPAGKLYNAGLLALKQGSFREAAAQFDEVDKQHPYSHWAKKAMVMSAFSHFRGKDYTTSSETAQRFLTLHPSDEEAPYAAFIMAESYQAQIGSVDRDQSTAAKAMEAYEFIIRTYPTSKYARQAEKKIEFAKDQLAGKEMSVGRFYLGKRNYLAALNRFKFVVEEYQTTRHVEEALHRLTESYLALGLVDEARSSAAVLGHNFPQSEWYKRSYQLLGENGLQPGVQKKGWLTKTFG